MHGSDRLVHLAEEYLLTGHVEQRQLQTELDYLFNQPHGNEIDIIVLACTHFPILRKQMALASEHRNVQWVDSSEAIARRVLSLLSAELKPTTLHNTVSNAVTFIFTDSSSHHQKSIAQYKRYLHRHYPHKDYPHKDYPNKHYLHADYR